MAYVTIKHGDTVLGELNDGDGLKLNTRGTAIDPSTGEYVGLFIREDIEIDVNYPSVYDWSSHNCPSLCFKAKEANSTISMSVSGTPTLNLNFQYTTDRETWHDFIPGTTTITLSNIDDKVYFKGNNPNGVNELPIIGGDYGNFKFVMTGSILASGNIMSLIDNGLCTTITIPNSYCFLLLFQNCTSLISSPELPATILTNSCYSSMFYGCTGLIVPPALPAIILSQYCYYSMFLGCISLVNSPVLPSTTLADYCYSYMFLGCTSLTIPPTLSATGLFLNCYSFMFYNCTSLTTAPELPAAILAKGCYLHMFDNCTALLTPPTLLASNLVESCYEGMFYKCSSLIIAPELPATTLAKKCYAYMFRSCSSLVTAPKLPATTLVDYCYLCMFYDCKLLTTPPALPATTLANYCYDMMFWSCDYLIVSNASGSGYSRSWRIPSSESFVNTYALYNVFKNCSKGSGRSSDDIAGAQGQSYTYYTQNIPVS